MSLLANIPLKFYAESSRDLKNMPYLSIHLSSVPLYLVKLFFCRICRKYLMLVFLLLQFMLFVELHLYNFYFFLFYSLSS